MHRHYCTTVGHDWQCIGTCECICNLPMEGHDHSECPVELRSCPDHAAEEEAQIFEATSDADSLPETTLDEPQGPVPHCQCGCADIDAIQIVGWCLWCDHVYSLWSPQIQDEHSAHYCPGAPSKLKQHALETMAKRTHK
jgi:hypothetical protein